MIHTHRHSRWSLLDGIADGETYAKLAHDLGQGVLGISDHGTLSGCIEHMQACHKHHVMPICGMEAYFKPDRAEKEPRNPWHLMLIAKNLTGWKNLLKASTEAHATGFYQKPSLDWEVLEKYHEGLICTTACVNSYLNNLIIKGDDYGVDAHVKRLLDTFGDDLFFEIHPADFDDQRLVNIEIIRLGQRFGVPVEAQCDVHFPEADWFETYRVAGLANTKMSFDKLEKAKEEGKKVLEFDLPTLYMMSQQEVEQSFAKNHPDIPDYIIADAIKNTHVLADRCAPFVIDQSLKFPDVRKHFPDPRQTVLDWCDEGLDRLGKKGDPVYEDRLKFELAELATDERRFDYFVIVADAVREANRQGVRSNTRGSAAGALVSNLCGITHIDPIAYGLLFERFMNPNRKDFPDIDLDFASEGRQKIKDYLAEKWGKDHVADIIAHQTLQPKAVLKMLAKVYDIPYMEIEAVTETIDIRQDDEETTLEQLVVINPVLDAFKQKYPELWKHALRLEGSPSNESKHAAGLIVTNQPITDHVPLEHSKDGSLVTAWNDSVTMKEAALSKLGLVKLDFLGINGLTKQQLAVDLIKEHYGDEVDLDNLPIMRDMRAGEQEVYDLFTEGKTLGIWQFGGEGITNLLKHIKPDWMGDLVAANALYRPGPMDEAFKYGDRKFDNDLITYWHDSVKPFLSETYGIVAYQEQVMEIVKALGNFTPGDADDMRKAIGKLYRLPGHEAREFMEGFRQKWMDGCEDNGINKKTAESIWTSILKFSAYGFNKSHSAAYAAQAYQDAHLKKHYVLPFYASLLSKEKDAEKRIRAIREARMLDVKVLPPDVNTSGLGFTIDGDAIRFGLLAINRVGDVAAQAIIDGRPYEDMVDFTEKNCTKGNVKVKKDVLKSLTESGALDCFGARDELSANQIASLEQESFGISISGIHPTVRYRDLIEERVWSRAEFEKMPSKKEVDKSQYDQCRLVVGGEITTFKVTKTKKGDPMAHCTVAWGNDEFRCTIFPREWAMYNRLMKAGAVLIQGIKDEFQDKPQLIVESMVDVEDLAGQLEGGGSAEEEDED